LTEQVLRDAQKLNDALLPRTRAYHEVWLEGREIPLEAAVAAPAVEVEDPLYGRTYSPRKFKVAFAIPPLNDTDVYSNCLGFVAVGQGAVLQGYNLVAGGGLGMSHGNAQTFPRVADEVGFVEPGQLVDVGRAVVTVFRDFGDRTNRKHARLKYVLAERGVDWFRDELAGRLGYRLAPVRPVQFTEQGDRFGWHLQDNGAWFLGLYVESGRIRDRQGYQLKTALREVVERFGPEVRLTPSQNLLLVNVPTAIRGSISSILAAHGVAVDSQGGPVRLASMACPALPTCGLALAESERFLPDLLSRVEGVLEETGLAGEPLIVRMTGCPNGCARSYLAELGLVGRAPGRYQLLLGGNAGSTRLNRVYRDNVKEADLVGELRPLFQRYASSRLAGERFGDWCARVIWPEQPSPSGASAGAGLRS
jgi:sulfite reductase (NADPH) hemoprotein beta-component